MASWRFSGSGIGESNQTTRQPGQVSHSICTRAVAAHHLTLYSTSIVVSSLWPSVGGIGRHKWSCAAMSSSESILCVARAVIPPLTQPPPAQRSHCPPRLFLTLSLSSFLLKLCAEVTWQKRRRVSDSCTWDECRMPRSFSTNQGDLLWTREHSQNSPQSTYTVVLW